MLFPLIFFLTCAVVESTVKFTESQVLDDVDLKSVNMVPFECSAGCRVYSPTKNDNIVIIDATLKEWASLGKLAELAGQVFYLPPGDYKLSNKGLADPSFVFWAVENGANRFDTKVVYVGAGKSVKLGAETDQFVTVMSSTGSVRFSEFTGDYSASLPTVYAAGADSANFGCSPVFTARDTATTLNADFTVLSPIATINFQSRVAARTVVVSGDIGVVATGEDTSSVFMSPGYVGCETVRGALYSNLPRVLDIYNTIRLANPNGLALTVYGNYSIAKAEDALTLSINDDGVKYAGTGTIYQTRDYSSKVNVLISWDKKTGNEKDNFAVQIDVTKNSAGSAPTTPMVEPSPSSTTKKADPGPVATTNKADPVPVATTRKADPVVSTSPRPPVDPTTSEVQPLKLLISSIFVLLALSCL